MVRYRRLLSCLSVAAGLLLLPAYAGAATIESFLFTQRGWQQPGASTPDPDAVLQGIFTGVVDPVTGLIAQANLTDFGMVFSLDGTGGFGFQGLGNLQLFFFNARLFDTDPGSTALLNIVTQRTEGTTTFSECVGFAAAVSPACNGNFPSGIRGVFRSALLTVFTTQNPQLTLLSRTEVPDPDLTPVSTVPEPATLLLLGTGLIGIAGRCRRR